MTLKLYYYRGRVITIDRAGRIAQHGIARTNKNRQPVTDWLSVCCPICRVDWNKPCASLSGKALSKPHPARRRQAPKIVADDNHLVPPDWLAIKAAVQQARLDEFDQEVELAQRARTLISSGKSRKKVAVILGVSIRRLTNALGELKSEKPGAIPYTRKLTVRPAHVREGIGEAGYANSTEPCGGGWRSQRHRTK